jgi:hypothetical protein
MDEKHMEDQTIPVHSADFCRRVLAEEQNEVHNDPYMSRIKRAEICRNEQKQMQRV